MRRLTRTVSGLAAAGALSAAVLAPGPVSAATTGVDMSGHSCLFDHTYADSSGGPGAVVHGTVPFTGGRRDPPDAADGAVRFDGRAADFLTVGAPVLSYGTADFTLELWLSTKAEEPETIVDTTGCEPGAVGLVVTLTGDGSVDLGLGHATGATDDEGGLPPTGETDATDDGGGSGTRGRVNDGRWHDVAVARTATTIVLSVDGRPIRTRTTIRVEDFRSDADVRIGRSACADAHAFGGELDDLTMDPAPAAALAETPLAVLLPVSAAMLGGAVTVVRRRRRAAPAHRITRP